MGPTNSPLPQQNNNIQSFDVPQTAPKASVEELNYAKVGESEGWKQLKEFYTERIEHMKQYLPGGKKLADLTGVELEASVKTASNIIDEHNSVIEQIEAITSAVKQQK